MVTLTVDLVGIVLFVLLGYLDDLILPRYYFYEDTIVGVYKQYQCPVYCGADHHHLVYYDKEITGDIGMCIDKSKLKEKYTKKRNKKKLGKNKKLDIYIEKVVY